MAHTQEAWGHSCTKPQKLVQKTCVFHPCWLAFLWRQQFLAGILCRVKFALFLPPISAVLLTSPNSFSVPFFTRLLITLWYNIKMTSTSFSMVYFLTHADLHYMANRAQDKKFVFVKGKKKNAIIYSSLHSCWIQINRIEFFFLQYNLHIFELYIKKPSRHLMEIY